MTISQICEVIYKTTDDDRAHSYQVFLSWYFECLRSGKANEVEDLFSILVASKVCSFMISAILRGTFSHREQFRSWFRFRDDGHQVMKDRGLDANHLLRGLMDNTDNHGETSRLLDHIIGVHPSLQRK
jgi:hypothetical protein